MRCVFSLEGGIHCCRTKHEILVLTDCSSTDPLGFSQTIWYPPRRMAVQMYWLHRPGSAQRIQIVGTWESIRKVTSTTTTTTPPLPSPALPPPTKRGSSFYGYIFLTALLSSHIGILHNSFLPMELPDAARDKIRGWSTAEKTRLLPRDRPQPVDQRRMRSGTPNDTQSALELNPATEILSEWAGMFQHSGVRCLQPIWQGGRRSDVLVLRGNSCHGIRRYHSNHCRVT